MDRGDRRESYDEVLNGHGLIAANGIIRLGAKTAPSVIFMGKDTTSDFIDDILDLVVCMEKKHFPTHGTIQLIVPLRELLVGYIGVMVFGRL
jgi:hypothetical protein